MITFDMKDKNRIPVVVSHSAAKRLNVSKAEEGTGFAPMTSPLLMTQNERR